MARIRLGVVGGIVGGAAMGMWMMLYYLVAGLGFWSPLGYIGHFLIRDTDITAPAQVIVGLAIHMMTSMVLGAAVARFLPPASRPASMMRGVAVALAAWVVLQYGALNLLDRVAFEGLVPRAFAIGHVLFGGMLGLVLGTASERGIPGVAGAA